MTDANSDIFTIGHNHQLLIQGVNKQNLLLTGNWSTHNVSTSESICKLCLTDRAQTVQFVFWFFLQMDKLCLSGISFRTSVGFSIEHISNNDAYFPEFRLSNRNSFILYNRCFSLHFLRVLLGIFLKPPLHFSTSAGLFPVNGVSTITGLNVSLYDLRSYNLVEPHKH